MVRMRRSQFFRRKITVAHKHLHVHIKIVHRVKVSNTLFQKFTRKYQYRQHTITDNIIFNYTVELYITYRTHNTRNMVQSETPSNSFDSRMNSNR